MFFTLLCERALRSRVTRLEVGEVELAEEVPNKLTQV